MTNRPSSINLTFLLILLNALLWAGFGVIVAVGAHPALPDSAGVKWVMTILAFASAAVLGTSGILLRQRNKIAFYPAVGLLAVIAFLTITDEFGYADLVVLLITLLPLGLLIKDRA